MNVRISPNCPTVGTLRIFINNKWQKSIKNVSHVLVFRYATKVQKSFELCNTLTHRFARRGATIYFHVCNCMAWFMHIYAFNINKI